jgi:hypothetical protein
MRVFARPVAAVAVVAALFTGLSPVSSFAAAEPTTGGDVDDGTFVPDEQAALKTKIVTEWSDLIDGAAVGDRDRLKADAADE